MVIEIFSRLPVRSVGRCRCLSTHWRSRLSDPQFLVLHFTKPQKQSLFLITADNPVYEDHYPTPIIKDADCSFHTIAFPISEESVLENNLDLPKNWVEVAGSLNGLILLEDRFGDLFLLNPVTREQVSIPSPYFYGCNLRPFRRDKMHGFGYDASTDDYKIVTLGNLPNVEEWIGVSVYSVKSGVWVLKENFPPHIGGIFRHRANGALLNGAIHWLALDKRSDSVVILAFHLDSEEFRQVPVPVPAPRYAGAEFSNVFVLGGCLCIVEMLLNESVVKAWTMKEYGLQESWVKFTLCVNMPGILLAKPLCYIGEDQVLLVDQNTRSLILLNVKDQTKKVMLSDSDVVADGCVFVESLLSPKELGIGSEIGLS